MAFSGNRAVSQSVPTSFTATFRELPRLSKDIHLSSSSNLYSEPAERGSSPSIITGQFDICALRSRSGRLYQSSASHIRKPSAEQGIRPDSFLAEWEAASQHVRLC